MERQYIEGNKLIAEFMDYEYTPSPIPVTQKSIGEKQFGWTKKMKWSPLHIKGMDFQDFPLKRYHLARTNDDLQFHRFWEWLMPVVEKIYEVTDEGTKAFAGLSIFEYGICAPKEDVWKSVVEFIKWYNKQLEDKNEIKK